MENLTSKSDEIIELTKKICEAVANDNIDFVKKYVSENLIFLEKVFGVKNRKAFNEKFVFDKFTKPLFQIVSSKKPLVRLQKTNAKVTFESPTDIGHTMKRFTFKGGFYRNIFYYSMVGNNWKLLKVEVRLTRFSKNNLAESWDYMRSFVSKYRISTVR